MARGLLAAQEPTTTGITPTYNAADATDGHMFVNDGKTLAHIKNGSGGAVVVTITRQMTGDGATLPVREVSVPAGEERVIGPFPPSIFNVVSGDNRGRVLIDFDVDTTITFSLIKLET